MRRRREARGLVALFGAVSALIALPGAAGAFTFTLGSTPAPTVNCDVDTLAWQMTTGSTSYVVPEPGGVITHWQTLGGPIAGHARLKTVIQRTTTSGQISGESALESVAPGVVNDFQTQIPVGGGESLGLFTPDGLFCAATSADPLDVAIGKVPIADPAPGTTVTPVGTMASSLLDVAVTVEFDGDGDGFGDETQDACPTDATTQAACPDRRLQAQPP